jgi:hypothetical protein
MIKAFTTGPGAVIALGLSRGNVDLLTAGKPVRVFGADVGQPEIQAIVIGFGETENEIEEEFRKAGLIGPKTAMLDRRYNVGLGNLKPDELAARMREAIGNVEHVLPDTTLALFAFDKPPGTNMGYIATANRLDVADAVGKWAAQVKSRRN